MSAGSPWPLLSALFYVGVLWSPFLQAASFSTSGAEKRSIRTRARPLFRRENRARRNINVQVYRSRGHGKTHTLKRGQLPARRTFRAHRYSPCLRGSSRDMASRTALSYYLFSFHIALFFAFHWPVLSACLRVTTRTGNFRCSV